MKKLVIVSFAALLGGLSTASFADGGSHSYVGAYGGTISGSWHNDNGVGGRTIQATGPNGNSKSFSSNWNRNTGTYSRTGTKTGRYGRSVSKTKTWQR